MHPAPHQHQAMQRPPHIHRTQLPQHPAHNPLLLTPYPRHPHRQTPLPINPLPPLPLHLQHLPRTLRHRHKPRRLVDLPPPRQVLETWLLDFDIQQHEGMQTYSAVLLDAIIEAGGFPGGREEWHGDRLAEVVELQACAADGGEDGGVVDGMGGDGEGAGAEEEVGVRRCAVGHFSVRDGEES